uniref:periphilin-1 isoform X1 n=1 Tax=Gasterosteus aculeatus aculeatus TaxID=481459 RepID=UPI001A99CC6D|nr:periphilin-1 isoform X1 [Gasterosteus aculeatus aculeatus]
MDHARPQDTQQNKGSMLRHREHAADERPADGSPRPADSKRLIRRVRSPSRPRARLDNSYKAKFGGRFHGPQSPREDHSFYKPGSSNQRYHPFDPRADFHRRDHFQHKPPHAAPSERERYEKRESADGSSPSKQNNATGPFVPRCSSSRDKDAPLSSDRNQSRERDHTGTRSKERERSRDGELPPATRDRAIQQKRKEIDEVYYQECEMFGLVAKMLIAKDPTLERPIQSALQENLRDIGKRCVEGMEKFIADYDAAEASR